MQQSLLNCVEDCSSHQRYEICKITDDGKLVCLYECIPDIKYAIILAQYAMDNYRAKDELICIMPGYNSDQLKNHPDFNEFAKYLAEEYKP